MISLEPLNKEDQKLQPQPQPQNKVDEEKQSVSEVSEFYPEYLRYLNEDHQGETQKVKDRLKQIQEFKNKISPMYTDQFQNFYFRVREGSISQQIVIIDAKFGLFQMVIKVLILNQTSPIHSINQLDSQGTFATIYKAQLFGKKTAIKCHKHKQGAFQQTFHRIVSQYFLLFIASQLEAGPCLNKQCGFDIIVYSHYNQSCIEFSMEECLQLNNLGEDQLKRNEISLKKALNRLHYFHFVHFDIKPQNICFSPTYDKQVFIDFGTSEILKENLGHKTRQQQFKGTIAYSGGQMLQVYYLHKPRMVDSYYNDVVGLQKSIQKIAIKNQQFVNNIYEEQFICDKTKEYLMILMKFYLLCQSIQSKNGYNLFIKYKSYILANHRSDLLKIIKKRPYSFSSDSIYKKINQSSSIKNKAKDQQDISHYLVANFSGFNQSKPEDKSQISRIIQQIQRSSQITFSTKEICTIQGISKIQTISILNKQIYFLNLARNIRVDDKNCPYQKKIDLSEVFVKDYLKIDWIDPKQYIERSIQYIFGYCFQGQFTAIKQEILQNVITSVVLYETKTEEQIVNYFKFLLSAKCDIQWKQKIVFIFFIAIQLIRQRHKTRYSYKKIQYQMLKYIDEFVKLHQNEKQFDVLNILVNKNQQQSENELFLTNKWKMYKAGIIFCPLMLAVQFFMLYLSSFMKRQQLPQFKNKQNVLEYLILQNNHYLKNKFSFISIYICNSYLSRDKQIKYRILIDFYKDLFRKCKFYKDFQLYYNNKIMQDERIQLNSKEENNIKKSIEQTTLVLKQQSPLYLLKIQRLYLDMILKMDIHIENIQILKLLKFNKMHLKQSLLQTIQGNHVNEYFYRGHLINQNIRIYFDHILDYYFRNRKIIKDIYSREAINNQLIKCVQQFYNYIAQLLSRIQCYDCKILSLVQLNRFWMIRMYLSRNFKNALHIQISLLSFIVKNKELRNMELQICESIVKFSSINVQQLMLIHEYLKLTSGISRYLTNNFISILPYVYLELFKRGDFLEISELIQELADQLLKNYNPQTILNHIRFLNQMYMNISLFKQQQFFFEQNVKMMDKWKKSKNPYLALNYYNILKARTQSHFRSFIFSFITFSLPILDPKSRQYILFDYYSQILNNFQPKSRRKYHYLNKMHYKHHFKQHYNHQNGKQGIDTYLRQLGQNITNNRWQIRCNVRYLKYKKCLIRYHQNIGNLLQ